MTAFGPEAEGIVSDSIKTVFDSVLRKMLGTPPTPHKPPAEKPKEEPMILASRSVPAKRKKKPTKPS